MNTTISMCCDCCYLGDKYSIPLPNDLKDVFEDGICKHYYCCCGDSAHYRTEITNSVIQNCPCFESE